MKKPIVSVVMPAYRAAGQISASIESVVGQTYANWELIVVDDCSPDDTADVVTEWARRDPRIRLIRKPENSGPAAARNTGIDAACGRYVAFLDSDDVWLPRKLDVQIAAMRGQDAVFSCTAYEVRVGDSVVRKVDVPKRIPLRRLLRGSVIGCLTVIYDTNAFGKRYFPNLDELITGTVYANRMKRVLHEDYALWLNMLSQSCCKERPAVCVGIPEVLAHYHERKESFSSNKKGAAVSQWIIYRKYMKLNLMSATYNFICYAAKGVLRRL